MPGGALDFGVGDEGLVLLAEAEDDFGLGVIDAGELLEGDDVDLLVFHRRLDGDLDGGDEGLDIIRGDGVVVIDIGDEGAAGDAEESVAFCADRPFSVVDER